VTGDKTKGDKVTRGQSDQDKVTGDKVKGEFFLGSPSITCYSFHALCITGDHVGLSALQCARGCATSSS
jgi:hypothetical protein